MAQASRNVWAIFAGVAVRILGPIGGTGRGIDADDSITPDAELAELFRDGAGFAHLREKIGAVGILSPSPNRRRWAARPGRPRSRPPGCERRFVPRALPDRSSVESMSICGANRNRSTPSKCDAVHFGRGREIEHGFEIDGRLGVRPFADQARPHGVVEGGIFVHGHLVFLPQGFGVRIARSEMLQDDQRIGGARVFNFDAGLGRRGR